MRTSLAVGSVVLVAVATACANSEPGPAGVSLTQGYGGDPFVEMDAGGPGGAAYEATGGFAQGGAPSFGGSMTGGAYAAGGAASTGGLGASGYATGGAGVGGFSNGGAATGGSSVGGFGSGGLGAGGTTNSGGACPLPFLCAGGAGGAAGGGAGGTSGAAGTAGVGGAGFCDNATCFDIFDCYLYFPDKTACKFTKCEGLLCKP